MRTLESVARLLVLTAAVAMLAAPPVMAANAGQDKPADVAGTWAITLDIGGNTVNPSVTLQQDGETLTGTYHSQVLGEQKVTGTIKGNAITFSISATFDGNNVKVTYTGTVDKTTMKGTVSLGELGEGTFTAKKQ